MYFLCTRPRIRFSKRQPIKDGKIWRVYIEVGQDKKEEELCFFPGNAISVSTNDCFIFVKYPEGDEYPSQPIVTDIHFWITFMRQPEATAYTVHYVGKTCNPHKRPLNGEHNGLSRLQSKTKDTGDDIFIFYNIFKTTILAENHTAGIGVITPVSTIGALATSDEAEFIEKCFIKYFNCDHQWKNKTEELSELSNTLESLSKKLNINSAVVTYDSSGDDCKYAFSSTNVKSSSVHRLDFPENFDRCDSIFE